MQPWPGRDWGGTFDISTQLQYPYRNVPYLNPGEKTDLGTHRTPPSSSRPEEEEHWRNAADPFLSSHFSTSRTVTSLVCAAVPSPTRRSSMAGVYLPVQWSVSMCCVGSKAPETSHSRTRLRITSDTLQKFTDCHVMVTTAPVRGLNGATTTWGGRATAPRLTTCAPLILYGTTNARGASSTA